MKKLFSLFSGVIATLIATPVIAQLPYNCGMWDATEFGYGLNPPIYCPVDSCWGNLGVYAEFVYFRPSEDDTFAYSESCFDHEDDQPVTNVNTQTNNFGRRKFDTNFKPGYRVGVLYQMPCDQWAIDANYTYFFTKTTRNSHTGVFTNEIDRNDSITSADPFINDGCIVTLPYNLDLFSQYRNFGTLTTQVGSTWKLRYNQVDVDLTREYFVGPAVAFRPYVGFRGLFIQQHLDSVARKDWDTSVTNLDYKSTIFQNLTCNSDAYGLHGGSEVTFRLCDGLALFGNAGIHLLWIHFTTEFNRIQEVRDPISDALEQVLSVPQNKESFDVMRFGADLQGGVEWSTLFNCNQNEFFVRFAWEHHIYLSQNCFRTYLDGEKDFQDNVIGGGLLSTTGDLALYGFSVGAGFTF